jgi:hypothetical protein
MEETSNKKQLLTRLSEFQQENIEILRSKKGHGYNYAPLELIYPVINPLLHKHGIGIYQETNWDAELTKQYVQTTIYSIDDLEDCKVSRTYLDESIVLPKMNKIQIEGALITYLRRYHIVIMLGLSTEEDIDGGTGAGTKAKKVDYVTIFQSYLDQGSKTEAAMMASYNNYKSQMTQAEITGIYTMIKEHFKSKTNA